MSLCGSSRRARSHFPINYYSLNISSTSDQPDLVLISIGEISISELTVCQNSSSGFFEAHWRKQTKYVPLILDLEEKELIVMFVMLENGTLGHFTKNTLRSISLILPSLLKSKIKSILFLLAKVAINCSKFIFQVRTTSVWKSSIDLFNL